MALAKKTLIFAIVGAVVLILGAGIGGYFGYQYLTQPEPVTEDPNAVSAPGPMLELGEFTANLADPETHIVRLTVTLELASIAVTEQLVDPGWVVRLKDEVLRTLKNQRYDSIRYAEGTETLKQELLTRLNTILPKVNGEAALAKVLVPAFLVQ